MTKIQPVTNPEGKAADLFGAITEQMGSVPNIFKTMGHSPATLEGFLGFSGALGGGVLSPALREQLALATAGANGCDYCASAHTVMGKGAGLDADTITSSISGQASDSKTQAALTFARNIIANRGNLADGELQAVRDAGFSEAEIVEIIAHVGLNLFTNYFNHIAATEIDFPVVSTEAASKAA